MKTLSTAVESLIYRSPLYFPVLSFEQLHKKKQSGSTSTAAAPKAAASQKNVPEKPPSQSPKTNVQDLKKFVHAERKPEIAKVDSKKPVETKKKEKESEKLASHEHASLAEHQKMGRKGKDIDEY